MKNLSNLFKWRNHKTALEMLIDSFIISAFVSVSTLTSEIPDVIAVWIVIKTFLIAFFGQLVFERGLKPQVKGK